MKGKATRGRKRLFLLSNLVENKSYSELSGAGVPNYSLLLRPISVTPIPALTYRSCSSQFFSHPLIAPLPLIQFLAHSAPFSAPILLRSHALFPFHEPPLPLYSCSSQFFHTRSSLHSRSFNFLPTLLRFPLQSCSAHMLCSRSMNPHSRSSLFFTPAHRLTLTRSIFCPLCSIFRSNPAPLRCSDRKLKRELEDRVTWRRRMYNRTPERSREWREIEQHYIGQQSSNKRTSMETKKETMQQ